jgi:hypothetical protein
LSGKDLFVFILLAALFLFCTVGAQAELIKVSKLKRAEMKFSLKRDIFSPQAMAPMAVPDRVVQRVEEPPPPPPQEEQQADLEDEIRQSVLFEGYITKKSRSHALLNVNGEYHVAGEGDLLLERIKVVKVEREMVQVEAEGLLVDIPLKGGDEAEGDQGVKYDEAKER